MPSPNRELDHPAREEIRLERVLHALSDSLRLGVVRTLATAPDEGLPCHAFDMPVGKSTSTHHLRVLREAGLIEQVYQGTSKLNVLREEDLESLFPGLLRAMLNAADRQTDRLG
jgi:DNA-binding transcriptional ArsR family regulator